MRAILSVLVSILLMILTALPCFAWDTSYDWRQADEQINQDIQNQRIISEMQRQTFELQRQQIRPPCQVPVVKPLPYYPYPYKP